MSHSCLLVTFLYPSFGELTTELPGAIIGSLWRRTAVAIYVITSSINDQWIAGI